MDKEAVVENAKKVGGVLLVISKYTVGILWTVIKWVFKALWWILKNFKFQSWSMK